jgi:hypothetical protein
MRRTIARMPGWIAIALAAIAGITVVVRSASIEAGQAATAPRAVAELLLVNGHALTMGGRQ